MKDNFEKPHKTTGEDCYVIFKMFDDVIKKVPFLHEDDMRAG